MTLQNLNKLLDKYDRQPGNDNNSTNIEQLKLLKGLPFYDWSQSNIIVGSNEVNFTKDHSNTFNHAIGLPRKNGQKLPLFDYEQLVYDTLQKHKRSYAKEAHSVHHADGIKHGQSLQFENNRKDIPKVGKNRRWRVIIFEYKKYDDGNRVE